MFITRGQNRGNFEPKKRTLRTAIEGCPVRVYPKRGAETGRSRLRGNETGMAEAVDLEDEEGAHEDDQQVAESQEDAHASHLSHP